MAFVYATFEGRDFVIEEGPVGARLGPVPLKVLDGSVRGLHLVSHQSAVQELRVAAVDAAAAADGAAAVEGGCRGEGGGG